MNENLKEIKAELVFKQKQLQFRPPLEELRAKYYREMKAFISIPSTFEGFGNPEVYRDMADTNAKSLVQVYRKAEILFARLGKLAESVEHWVVLGKVDLDAYVTANVTDVNDWDVNFKMLKQKRKDSEKIPDVYRVDCITVSAIPLKATIDEQLQRLSDVLLMSLRAALTERLKTVETYLHDGMERLMERPGSIQEIGEAKKGWKELNERKTEMKIETRACDGQKRLLMSVVSSGAGITEAITDITTRMARLPDAWENFELTMEAFNMMVEEQRDEVKGRVEGEVIEVNQKLDKFGARWKALKPKEIEAWTPQALEGIYKQLAEWRTQLDQLKEEADQLAENSASFGMTPPKFDGLEALEADVKETETAWEMYKTYSEELQAMADQDWISFGSHIFDLQDFGTKWTEAMRDRPRDIITEHIEEECNNIKRAMPALKYARGEPFKDEHWSQLMRKLGIPRGTTLATLKVSHFLDVLPACGENVAFLKNLQSQAQGEVTIRDGLNEARSWMAVTEFSTMEHESNVTGLTTLLIRYV